MALMTSVKIACRPPAGRTYPADRFPKRCGVCGRIYTEAEWRALPWCGDQGDEVETIELRDCARSCGNTLAVKVAR
jgi:hypothetical protein